MGFVHRQIADGEAFDPVIEPQGVDRAGADHAPDALLGGGFVHIEAAGAVDAEDLMSRPASRVRERCQVDDGLHAAHLRA